MELPVRRVRLLLSDERPVTFISPKPADGEYPAATTANIEMPDAEESESNAPTKVTLRQGLRNAEKYERLLHSKLTEAGVYIQAAEETCEVQGHLVHSVKPIAVYVPELLEARACLAKLQGETASVPQEELGFFHHVTLGAYADLVSTLRRQLDTANDKNEDLRERLGEEKDITAAQAAKVEKMHALYEEAEEQRRKAEDDCEIAETTATSYYDRGTRFEIENGVMRDELVKAQRQYSALWYSYSEYAGRAQEELQAVRQKLQATKEELRKYKRDLGQLASKTVRKRGAAQRRARATRRVLPALIRAMEDGRELRKEVAAAKARERAAVEALGCEQERREELSKLACRQYLDAARIREGIKVLEKMTARHEKLVKRQLVAAFGPQYRETQSQTSDEADGSQLDAEDAYEEQPVAEDAYEEQPVAEDAYEEQPAAEDVYEYDREILKANPFRTWEAMALTLTPDYTACRDWADLSPLPNREEYHVANENHFLLAAAQLDPAPVTTAADLAQYVRVGEGYWRNVAEEAARAEGKRKEVRNMPMLLPPLDWDGEVDYPAGSAEGAEEEEDGEDESPSHGDEPNAPSNAEDGHPNNSGSECSTVYYTSSSESGSGESEGVSL